jgi:hypothetical protein
MSLHSKWHNVTTFQCHVKLFMPTLLTVASVFLKAKLLLIPAAENIATTTTGVRGGQVG